MMKVFAFIPARFHSTRFPGKPLALILDKPMIQHVYERVRSSNELSEVYVATDDERILKCVQGFGGKGIMTGKGHRSGTDRVWEAARKTGLEPDDIVINIQGDQPLLPPSVISELVLPLKEDSSLPMATLKWKIRDEADLLNPNHVKVVTDREGYALYFSRSAIPFVRDRHGKTACYKHLGIYGYRMAFLARFTRLPKGVLESVESLEQLRALENGFRIKVVETPFNSIEVDVPADIEKVEKILRATP